MGTLKKSIKIHLTLVPNNESKEIMKKYETKSEFY